MVQQQRYAVFTLSVGAAALVLFVALLPRLGWVRAQAGFSVLAVWGLAPLLFRRRGGIGWDERGRLIHLRSIQLSGAALWLLFVGGLTGVYFHHAEQGWINAQILPLVVWIGTAAILCVHAIFVLVLYLLM